MSAYSNTQLFVDGSWRDGSGNKLDVVSPVTGDVIGSLAHAREIDLEEALGAADRSFATWRWTSPLDRSKLMRRAADILRERAENVARLMTMEQGKPLAEARIETLGAADTIDWFAEEARRTYGRVVPARATNITQLVVKDPVGPVAAFTPWNFPLNQAVRKVSAALAAGCSVILKGPEETPASCAELVRAFADAGLPDGVLNLVYGDPATISGYLIPHPVIRKISFTGSTVVGKHLASLAGLHMKRVTMELGGHAPAIVFEDADVQNAVKVLSGSKFRNAGQVCVAPTRFLVQAPVFDDFLDGFARSAAAINVGDGLLEGTGMGPLANRRRVEAMEELVADAVSRGARLVTGGSRIGNRGNFFQPTVLADVPLDARAMNEEPFGPLALVNRFDTYESAAEEANRLPYGLAAYAYTTSARTVSRLTRDIESGMLSMNHHGLGLPELPFGGIKDSGYGSEGGSEAIENYLNTRLVTNAA